MTRRLYIYYRVAEADLGALAAAVRQAQAELMSAHPVLRCELLRRPDAADGQVTLMETYAADKGIDAALQRHVEAMWTGRALPLQGTRHIEVFEAL